jgi:hypothetical protein
MVNNNCIDKKEKKFKLTLPNKPKIIYDRHAL